MEIKKLVKNPKTWIFLAVLAAVFLLVYSPHFSYSYPLHVDEWVHLGLAKGKITRPIHPEFAYQLFLKAISPPLKLLGTDIILFYRFLPALFACTAAVILFYFMYKLTKSFFIAIFSMIFFASLPTDVNLMGLWFATPFSLCIPLIYLFFFLFISSFKEKSSRDFIWSIVILFVILAVHASSAFFILPVLLVYFVLNRKDIEKKHLTVFIPYFAAFLAVLVLRWSGDLGTTLGNFLKLIAFEYGRTPLDPVLLTNPVVYGPFVINPYLIPLLYGLVPFTLALIGIYFYFRDERFRIFTLWFLVTAFLLFLFNLTDVSIFARRQHMVYYAMLSLIPLSAAGLKKLMDLINGLNLKKAIRSGLAVALILFVMIAAFYNYWNPEPGTELYYLVDDNDYRALLFLKNITDSNKVIAPLEESVAIPAISEKPVLAGIWPRKSPVIEERVRRFFSVSNCSEKEWIILTHGANYVYSTEQINCKWVEIYDDQVYIYNVTERRLRRK